MFTLPKNENFSAVPTNRRPKADRYINLSAEHDETDSGSMKVSTIYLHMENPEEADLIRDFDEDPTRVNQWLSTLSGTYVKPRVKGAGKGFKKPWQNASN